MDEPERERLRDALRHGTVEEADLAMLRLLDVADPQELDPDDVTVVLEAMERLGEPGWARMFETFMLLASQSPQATVPALVAWMHRAPLSWTAGLCAAVIGEVLQYVPDGWARLDHDRVLEALLHVVEAAARAGSGTAAEAVRTLHAWAAREPLPQAGPALAELLMRAAEEPSPNEYFLSLAVDTILLNGQAQLLDPVRARNEALPESHPLRRALAGR